ncbi:MAG: hypothetical protein AABZ60_14675 [Planctomycetota bacterium]
MKILGFLLIAVVLFFLSNFFMSKSVAREKKEAFEKETQEEIIRETQENIRRNTNQSYPHTTEVKSDDQERDENK